MNGQSTFNGQGQLQNIGGQLNEMSLDDSQRAATTQGRKKKTRHVLDASLGPAQSAGFANSQFNAQGHFTKAQDPYNPQPQHGAVVPGNIHPQVEANPQFTNPYTSHGSDLPGQSRQLESGQFPSLVEDTREAVEYYRNNLFYTAQANALNPPASIDFSAIDHGVSNPKFARLSMGSLPANEELLVASQLPMSLILHPLADLNPEETQVPLVNSIQSVLPRCHRCRTYMNPGMTFINGGAKYTCNICGFANETPADYYSPSDISGRRQDWDLRPELQYGTCDFDVGSDFWAQNKQPRPVQILFAIDVSEQSLLRNVPRASADAIRQVLYGESEQKLPDGAKIGIITFDRACHFYNLSPAITSSTQVHYVPDVDDMFVPFQAGLFADPQESRTAIEMALDTIGSIFERQSVPEPALGALCRAAYLALHENSGKLCLFLGALPTWGPGKLRVRESTVAMSSTDEKALYDTASVHWKNVAEEFVGIGVGVDCFLFPSSYIDVATVGTLAQITGGDTFYYQNFIYDRDHLKFEGELQRALFRTQGSAVQMKIRCSNGLSVVALIGNFLQKGNSDLEMGTINADKAVTCVLKHDGKLDAKSDVHMQSAVLFTTPDGRRRLRIHNIRCAVSTQIGEVMRHCDAGAAVVTIAKTAALQVLKNDLKVVKQSITDQCVRILAAYRKNCATGVAAGELILPESLKLFPLLTLAVQKQFCFRADNINSDVRVNNQRLIRSCSARDLLSLIYPRLIPIHNLTDEEGFADANGKFIMPQAVRNSFSQLQDGGVYILDNGQTLFLWFKADTTPALLQDLYGPEINSLEMLVPRKATLPELDTLLNVQVRNIIAYLNQFSTSRVLVPQIARQGIDGSEQIFAQSLIDDRNCDNMSYPDFLIQVHKLVQLLLAERTQSKGLGSWIGGTEQAY